MSRVKGLMVAGVAAAVFACATGAARADVATLPNDGTSPFDGGASVTTPLETLAGTIASTVAGRPVSVHCEPDADWAALAAADGFGPSQVLGFVGFVNGAPLDYAELSPDVCRSLQSFAEAATKPTKCSAVTSVPHVVVKIVHGRKIHATTYVRVAQPIAPCFANGRQLMRSNAFWNQYFYTAEALQTLVHESVHLEGEQVEARAECFGMQSLAYAAQQLGDTPDDAAAIARFYATRVYPVRRTQSPTYWSADCRENGALDLTPNDGVWP